MSAKHPAWTGMVPVDDTTLYVADTGGSGRTLVYLNGSYANQKHWQKVISELGGEYRHITYDERARGRSKRSADYSFEACVRDLDAVLRARGVERPILVGWSYGAMLAAHWAARYPGRVEAVVAVDGAIPYGLTGAESEERIRKLFRRMRLLFPIAARLGLAARMSADQHADVNIECNEMSAVLAPVLDRVSCPMWYILATGAHLGAEEEEMGEARAALDPVLARNPNLQVGARVTSNHSKILQKDSPAVAGVIRRCTVPRDHSVG